MSKSLVKIARITFALTLVGAVVAGCGRKGELDRPSTPLEQQNIRKNTKPGEPSQKQPVEDRPFLLDPLL